MDYAKVCLHRGEERDIRSGGWWVYDNEIDWIDDICTDGGIVDVLDVMTLTQMIVNQQPYQKQMDYNENQELDVGDVMYLAQRIVNQL